MIKTIFIDPKGCEFHLNEAGGLIMIDEDFQGEIVAPEAVLKFADFLRREAEARIFAEKEGAE